MNGLSIEDYAWGQQDFVCPSPPKNEMMHRSRKVTITEITEEIDDWEMVSGAEEESGDCSSVCDEYEGTSSISCSSENEEEMEVEDDDANEASAMMGPDEAFQLFDDLVADWKAQLEAVIGEGLKKMRKNGKEKKLMMQYLPGSEDKSSKMTEAAKTAIVKEWLSEFNKTLDQTSKKLEKLSKAKLSEAEATAHGKVLPAEFVVEKNNINKNKKTIVNLKFDDEEKKEGNLRQLLFDLENVCTLFSNNGGSECIQMPTIPIFKPTPEINNKRSLGLDWRKERAQFLQRYFEPLRQSLKNQETIRDILEDFKIKHYFDNKLIGCNPPVVPALVTTAVLQKLKSDNRRMTHVNVAQKRMLERKQRKEEAKNRRKEEIVASDSSSGKYKLLQVSNEGKERFFIIKKKEYNASSNPDAEEIFAEWHKNLDAPIVEKRRKRVRKLSHRSVRREILKTAEKEGEEKGTVLYADIVKKNLKNSTSSEDIFEAWKENLQESREMEEKAEPRALGGEEGSEELDIFKVWRHNLKCKERRGSREESESEENILSTAERFRLELSGGGSATIPIYKTSRMRIAKTATFKVPSSKTAKKIRPAMASNKHCEIPVEKVPALPLRVYGSDYYQPEEFFSQWRQNLYATKSTKAKAKKVQKPQPPMPENVFSDWIGNLREPALFGPKRQPIIIRQEKSTKKNPTQPKDKENEPFKVKDDFLDDDVLDITTQKSKKKWRKGKNGRGK